MIAMMFVKVVIRHSGYLQIQYYLVFFNDDVIMLNNFYRSFGEIAYICMGRPSIYIINFVITAATSLIVTMYALLFSKICVSFALNLYGGVVNNDNFFEYILTTKLFYIIILYVILLGFVVKKSFKELKITSILLIVGVISMLLIFFAKSTFKE